jgi:hypothetical protein
MRILVRRFISNVASHQLIKIFAFLHQEISKSKIGFVGALKAALVTKNYPTGQMF